MSNRFVSETFAGVKIKRGKEKTEPVLAKRPRKEGNRD